MTQHGHEADDARPLQRRTLLQGAALTGVAVVVAGCGQEAESTPSPADAADTPTTSPTSAPESSAPESSKPAEPPLTDVKDVPIGGGVIVDEVVVTQPTQGTFKAFTAICTHQGCTVSDVVDDVITCPCHGSSFSAADGAVLTGPAAAPLAEIPVEVTGGKVLPA